MADKDPKLSSAESSDREGDTFEDAPDSTSRPQSQQSQSSASIRSLTGGRPPSTSSVTTPRQSESQQTMDESPSSNADDPSHKAKEETYSVNIGSKDSAQNSPLLTARRISTSSLDDVQLGDTPVAGDAVVNDRTDDESRSRSNTITAAEIRTDEPVPAPSASAPPAAPKLPPRSQGFSGSLPSVPWGPPPALKPSNNQTIPSQPAAPPRKLAGPFSWLSRSSSAKVESTPPPKPPPVQTERRSTVTSISSTGGNPELMLSRLDEGNESDSSNAGSRRYKGNSLRDRFKILRMREEAGIQSMEAPEAVSPSVGGGALAGLVGRSASVGLGFGSPTSVAEEKEKGLAISPAQSPASTVPPPIDLGLAPGTAVGVSVGPSALNDPTVSVDWDLWQSVVHEGPAIVARTSAEELKRAIASGIPSAIRGVVWQVLAQSKNEDLEGVYRDLIIRGTEKDRDNSFSGLNGHLNGQFKEKQSTASSASSIHSEQSTQATTSANDLASPLTSHDKDSENAAKLQAAMVTERKKKSREDAAALQKLEKVIRKDLGARTSYSKYAAAAGLQEGLFGVCKAYALFDEGVGYAQGMNFLVMPLLFNMPEEEAFCLLVRLMNHYHLRDMFIQDMPGLHLHLYQFERLLEDFEPALYCHLHRKHVSPQLYATQWFLTLFAYRFPLQLVLRVYDLILSEGLEGAILKFGITLMQKNAETLLGMNDMAKLTSFLKDRLFDVYIDQAPSANSVLESGFFGSSGGIEKEIYRADVLVQDACAVKITPELLKQYSSEWEEKNRLEKEKEAEIESLRSTNASLSLKVRVLETRNEKSDTEHVELASELVRTKVENQELQDKVESLKGQVDELRSLVEKQPEEVEKRLKDEMDRIMTRNLEVQNENRGLEEQMADMEKVLVETKMQYAELNSEHDSLMRKWADVRKMIEP